MVGEKATRDYYVGRSAQKGVMRHEVFDTVVWGDVAAALNERSKKFKMWYAKQGLGFCGVGYWMSKWEKTEKTTKEEEIESSRCPSYGMRQEKAAHLNRCKNSSRRAVFERQVQVLEEWMGLTYTHPLVGNDCQRT